VLVLGVYRSLEALLAYYLSSGVLALCCANALA
jgi:hypothetical protein